MQISLAYPTVRPRRLRANKLVRDAVAETELSPADFIMPIFVKKGPKEPIEAMPGYYRWPVGDELVKHVEEAVELGVNKFILFGVLPDEEKDPEGKASYDPHGVVPAAIRMLKETFGDRVLLFADVCLCEYTDHGHCGVITVDERGRWRVDNDKTIAIYAKEAVTYADAGVDFVAPSGMMDGQVKAIRQALDSAGYQEVGIMAYSAKYASAFYGPFRVAAASAPKFGDRRTYQMDPRNANEAVKEVMLDLEEGADIVMVKPALAYLDVIRLVKQSFPWAPLAAYSVSGEYSMIKAAAKAGYLDERIAALEVLYAIKRAGADLILTYYAVEAAKWLKEGAPF